MIEDNNLVKIPDYPGYFINKFGEIYSDKSGKLKQLKPYLDSRKRYLQIGLINSNGKRYKLLLHRIVATVFIPNPNNLPEVNHRDYNPQNCKVDNLEWCTRKENLEYSHILDNSVKFYKKCSLYNREILIQEFKSIKDACRYAQKEYGVSFYALQKNHVFNDFFIVIKGNTLSEAKQTLVKIPKSRHYRVLLYQEGTYIATCRSIKEAARFIANTPKFFSAKLNVGSVASLLTKKNIYKEFNIIRQEM